MKWYKCYDGPYCGLAICCEAVKAKIKCCPPEIVITVSKYALTSESLLVSRDVERATNLRIFSKWRAKDEYMSKGMRELLGDGFNPVWLTLSALEYEGIGFMTRGAPCEPAT